MARTGDPAYDALRGSVALICGCMAALGGLAVGISLAVSLADRLGASLPGALGDVGWKGYLLAWFAAIVCTPFAALSGTIAGGAKGRLAGIGGLAWLAGIAFQVAAPLVMSGGTGAATGIGSDLPASSAVGAVFSAVSLVVMVVLPIAVGAMAVVAGLALLDRSPNGERSGTQRGDASTI